MTQVIETKPETEMKAELETIPDVQLEVKSGLKETKEIEVNDPKPDGLSDDEIKEIPVDIIDSTEEEENKKENDSETKKEDGPKGVESDVTQSDNYQSDIDLSESKDSGEEESELWEERMLREKKEQIQHWKDKIAKIGNSDAKEIISSVNIPNDKDYFLNFNPKNMYDCPIDIRRIKNYIEEWKGRSNNIDKREFGFGFDKDDRAEIEEQILHTCNSLKWMENYFENANAKYSNEEFKRKAYPQLVRVKRILINLYKDYNRVECARFLKNHKVTYKYGNKKYEETKPKKNRN